MGFFYKIGLLRDNAIFPSIYTSQNSTGSTATYPSANEAGEGALSGKILGNLVQNARKSGREVGQKH